MNRPVLCIAAAVMALMVLVESTPALDADALRELKSAGVGDDTLAMIVSERVVETAAFSVAEIVALKKAGFGEKTLQSLIRAGSFLNGTEPIVYGRAVRPVRMASVEDIISLKAQGFSDEVIQAIIAVAGPSDQDERRRAFELLEGMNIRVDLRGD